MNEVLEAVATILRGITKPEQPEGNLTVFVYPELVEPDPEEDVYHADSELVVDLSALPCMVVHRDIYGESRYQRRTQVDYWFVWTLLIEVFLSADYDLPSSEKEKLITPWQAEIVDVLLSNPTLGGTVEHFGNALEPAGDALSVSTPFVHWYEQKTEQAELFCGLSVRLQVTQEVTYEETIV